MTEKRFTVHIKWFNYDKTEGEIELFDNGQPLLVSECIKDVQMIKDLLNELVKENKELRSDRDYWKTLAQSLARTNGNVELKDEHLAWKRVDVE